MSTFTFLSGPGHLPEQAGIIAQRHGATLINCPASSGHWFTAPNADTSRRNASLRYAVAVDLSRAGIVHFSDI